MALRVRVRAPNSESPNRDLLLAADPDVTTVGQLQSALAAHHPARPAAARLISGGRILGPAGALLRDALKAQLVRTWLSAGDTWHLPWDGYSGCRSTSMVLGPRAPFEPGVCAAAL